MQRVSLGSLSLCLSLLAGLGCGSTSGAEKTIAPAPTAPVDAPAPEAAAAPAKAPVAPIALEEYFKISRVGFGASFSHDEKWVAFSTDRGGQIDVWVAPVEGGEPKQVTHVDGFLGVFAFSPAADRLLYSADQGGNELPHLYLTNSKGESPKDITAKDPATSRAEFIRWADDGKTFLYLSNRRDEKYLDLYEYDVKTEKSELLWKSADKLSFALASRDAKRFVALEMLSDVNSNLYLVERGKKSATPVLLTPHQGDVRYSPTSFSKDAKALYFTSDQAGEFSALFAMDLAAKTSKSVLSEDWDVEGGKFSESWRYFVTNTNVDGLPKIVVTDVKTEKPVELPGVTAERALMPVAFSKSDRYIAAAVVTDSAPRNISIVDLKTGSVFQPIDPFPQTLRDASMVTGRSVQISSFDQRLVPAYVYAPAGPGPFPAVIDVHGGPTAQSRRAFNPMRQYLVSKGYVVLVPNVRGSTGYGKTYTKLDNLDLGGGPLKDVVAAKSWLERGANVDKSRVAVMGGSYGGYMSLAAATFTPTEFAAHVDYFGVSDLKSLVESFPPYWAAHATYIYQKFGDPKNPEHAKYQAERSPLNSIDKIQRPLLVVQGENDARVKKDQSDRVIAKLKDRGVPVHYLVLTGEGHGFSKNENRLAAYRATDKFLDRYLFNDTSVLVPTETPPEPRASK